MIGKDKLKAIEDTTGLALYVFYDMPKRELRCFLKTNKEQFLDCTAIKAIEEALKTKGYTELNIYRNKKSNAIPEQIDKILP